MKFPQQIQRKFCAEYHIRIENAPTKNTIYQRVKKLKAHGAVLHRHVGNSGRKNWPLCGNIATVRKPVPLKVRRNLCAGDRKS